MKNKKKHQRITRNEFIKRSSAGLIGVGVMLNNPVTFLNSARSLKKVTLGRSGLKVTSVGFGASRTQEPALLKAALDAGMNFIDTGRSYANGQNEVMVGKTIKTIRKSLVIQSKVKIKPAEKGVALLSKKAQKNIQSIMQTSLDASLAALQTDYIDIWLIHGVDSVDILHHETVLDFFEHKKSQGIIKACGFSTHSNQTALLQSANEKMFYDVYMVTYNHKGAFAHSNSSQVDKYDQNAVEKELKKAFDNGVGVIGMKTCSGGPYAPEGNSEPTFGQAVKWVVEQPYVHTAAVAMANFDQIREDTEFL